jgi:hydrogenase maturation protease
MVDLAFKQDKLFGEDVAEGTNRGRMMKTKQVLVIGMGNPLRQDDGAGPQTIDRLRRLLPDAPVNFLTVHQLTPDLAQPVSGSDLTFFIDASAGDKAGRVQIRRIYPAEYAVLRSFHSLTPETLLSMAAILYNQRPKSFLCTVGGASFTAGHEMTTGIAQSTRRLAVVLAETIRNEMAFP